MKFYLRIFSSVLLSFFFFFYILRLFGELPKAESGIQVWCLRFSLLLWPEASRDLTFSVINTDRIWALIRIYKAKRSHL